MWIKVIFFIIHTEEKLSLEAFAANSAGAQVKILLREGNAPISEEAKSTFESINSFEEIL